MKTTQMHRKTRIAYMDQSRISNRSSTIKDDENVHSSISHQSDISTRVFIVTRNGRIVWKVVLLAAELEFPKILVRRLPQQASDVNIECTGKSECSKQLYSLYLTSFLEH